MTEAREDLDHTTISVLTEENFLDSEHSSDVVALADVAFRPGQDPRTKKSFFYSLTNYDQVQNAHLRPFELVCLVQHGRVIGVAGMFPDLYVYPDKQLLYLHTEVVHPAYRGKGYYRVLVESRLQRMPAFYERVFPESSPQFVTSMMNPYQVPVIHRISAGNGYLSNIRMSGEINYASTLWMFIRNDGNLIVLHGQPRFISKVAPRDVQVFNTPPLHAVPVQWFSAIKHVQAKNGDFRLEERVWKGLLEKMQKLQFSYTETEFSTGNGLVTEYGFKTGLEINQLGQILTTFGIELNWQFNHFRFAMSKP